MARITDCYIKGEMRIGEGKDAVVHESIGAWVIHDLNHLITVEGWAPMMAVDYLTQFMTSQALHEFIVNRPELVSLIKSN
jgi:hypothetical protein